MEINDEETSLCRYFYVLKEVEIEKKKREIVTYSVSEELSSPTV
jgi:hypothetical protein